MMNNKNLIFILCSFFLFAAKANADDSPYSPAFILKEQQLLSTTTIGASRIEFHPYTAISGVGTFNFNKTVSSFFARQSFNLGLANNTEIGITESYSDTQDTGIARLRTVDGFSNPTFSARKTWWAESPVRLSMFGSVTPKTGGSELREQAARYNLGMSGVFITESGLVMQLGASRTVVDGYSANLSIVSAGLYKEIGLYAISLAGAIQSFDSPDSKIFLGRDTLEVFNLGISRRLNEKAWLQVIYEHSDTAYREREVAAFTSIGLSTRADSIGASLKLFF